MICTSYILVSAFTADNSVSSQPFRRERIPDLPSRSLVRSEVDDRYVEPHQPLGLFDMSISENGLMNVTQDIRWVQRLSNYQKALGQLRKFIAKGELNELEEQGLIQAFVYTHELAWNTLKDFLQSRGNQAIYGSKDATREAFRLGLLEDGETWMDMIQSRNKTSHTYNEETAKEIVKDIQSRYFPQFERLAEEMERLKAKENA